MSLRYKNGEEVSDSIGLIISMLVRYPEISSIHYEPSKEEIKFTFLLNNNTKNIDDFYHLLNNCIDTYHLLEYGEKVAPVNISCSSVGNISIVDLYRKIKELSPQELNLIIMLIQDYFADSLVIEVEELTKEDQILQEDLISTILDNFKQEAITQKVIAFREEGKVLVFNK